MAGNGPEYWERKKKREQLAPKNALVEESQK
jgi:hypothetical protein